MSQNDYNDERTEIHESEVDNVNFNENETGSIHHNSSTTVDDNFFVNKKRKLVTFRSKLWSKFTVISRANGIAECNICGRQLSFKTTISNLKKHLDNKHNYDIVSDNVFQSKRSYSEPYYNPSPKKSDRTQSGGMDGLILRVIGESEPEDPTVAVVEEEVGTYTVYDAEEFRAAHEKETAQERHRITVHSSDEARKAFKEKRGAQTPRRQIDISENNTRQKRNRIMDLQLECLEIRKYNMQMEALVMERQLNIRRSIFTEPLRGSNYISRGTQTEVGGNNTKVFYVTDSKDSQSEGTQQIFSFQRPTD